MWCDIISNSFSLQLHNFGNSVVGEYTSLPYFLFAFPQVETGDGKKALRSQL